MLIIFETFQPSGIKAVQRARSSFLKTKFLPPGARLSKRERITVIREWRGSWRSAWSSEWSVNFNAGKRWA